jgi:FAD/FMN-containing dehydrogenase
VRRRDAARRRRRGGDQPGAPEPHPRVDADNDTLTVEAGCTLAAVQEAAQAVGRLFPLALASEGSCMIGGNLSTNAGGVQVLRYGNTRELVLGLEVVLPDGRVWDGLRGLRKDNTGYDLKQLFIGAEGTLGIVTAAVLKLFPAIRSRATAWVAVPDPARRGAPARALRAACGDRVSAFEIVGRPALELVLQHIPGARDPLAGAPAWTVLVELSDPAVGCAARGAARGGAGRGHARAGPGERRRGRGERAQAQALWALRENISEAQRIEGISIKHDVSVPVSRIPEFLERAGRALARAGPDVRVVAFGHIGDGNLHYNLSKPRRRRQRRLHRAHRRGQSHRARPGGELGGSISAEHGLGQLKREEVLRYKPAPVEMELMRRSSRPSIRGADEPGQGAAW